jgi:voltage-gated potassium channel
MKRLKRIVETSDTPAGRAFALAVQFLIVVSLVSFSIETLPDLPPRYKLVLDRVETVCVLLFTAEYILRFSVSSNRFKFVTSFFGVIDLLAILPFYLSTGLDLRVIRAFRLLRLFRILKLARYSKAAHRFYVALKLAKEELVLFVAMSGIVLYLAAVGIYYFENPAQPEVFKSIFHSLWWAVVTLTTVGYGDMCPVTTGGKAFTFAVLLVGLGLVSVPAGLVASALSKARELESEGDRNPDTRRDGSPVASERSDDGQ